MTIISDPPGALVRVDDTEIGTTPVSTSFVYYGTRKIQLIMPGYETLTVLQPVPMPWYQTPGLDFFSEHFAMREIRDERVLNYRLQPKRIVSTDELLQRADQLRGEGRGGLLQPPLPVAPPAAVPAVPGMPPPDVIPAPPPVGTPAPPTIAPLPPTAGPIYVPPGQIPQAPMAPGTPYPAEPPASRLPF
jgi:hypothetical protein